jgi:hypothetical protein
MEPEVKTALGTGIIIVVCVLWALITERLRRKKQRQYEENRRRFNN